MSDESASLVPELRATLGKLEVALGVIADAIVWTDQQGCIQWCNAAFDRLVGRRHLEVLGAKLTDVLPLRHLGQPLPVEQHPVMLALTTAGRSSTEFHEFLAGNQTRILEIFRTTLTIGTAITAILTIRDITDQKRAEETLQSKMHELESFNRIMMNREERILELKTEIHHLREEIETLRKALPPRP